jgi:RNA polymerase sigma-70 factor (ECF subfamily)
MYESEDKKIIENVLSGNTDSFRLLIDRYQKTIYNLTYRITGDPEDAKEVTQCIFVKIYSNLNKYNPAYKFFSWMYRIAINESLSFQKTKRNFSTIDENMYSDQDNPEKILDDKAKEKEIQQAIKRLKYDYRILIIMKYYEGFSYEKISSVTGIPVKKIRSRLFTARQILKDDLINLL